MVIEDKKLGEFLKEVYTLYGYDFIHYNYNTLKRRIEVHAIQLQISGFESYTKLILENKEEFEKMFSFFSVNVTEFFREPEQLKLFRENVIPYINSFAHVKIWCAGCSSGESPYSMAMILYEEGVLDKCQIYATDFNNRILAKAKQGLFEIKDINLSQENYQQSGGKKNFSEYFIKKGKFYHIKNILKEKILFFNHNLVTDGIMNEFQVVICKNVIIYFNVELKRKVINLFNDSLSCNGFLVLGKNEFLPEAFNESFKLFIPSSKVYQKKC